MKKQIIGMVAAAAMVLPLSAGAAEVTWGGEFSATGFVTDVAGNNKLQNKAFYQVIKVKPTFQLDNGVSLITSINLYQNYWLGDRRTGAGQAGAGSTTGDGSDNISLEMGYLQMPLFGGTLRVGRQLANWGFGMTTSNDARDRVTFLKAIGGITALAVYDKRQEGVNVTEGKLDGDMLAVAAIGTVAGFQWGMLVDYWDADANYSTSGIPNDPTLPSNQKGYVLEDLWGIHPYISGKAGPVGIKAAANFLFGNGKGKGLWANDSIAMFVRGDMDFGPVMVEGQVMYVMDGGLVDTGFDSFSHMFSNAERNSFNPMRVGSAAIGGLGTDGDDQLLVAVRATMEVMDGLTVAGAVGHFDAEDQYGLKGFGTKQAFVDLSVEYALNRQVSFFGAYGQVFGDKKKSAFAWDIQGTQAMMAGVRAKF